MSNSPIIFHVCGDTHTECCRRKSNNDIQHRTSHECRCNSNNDIWRETSSECRHNSTNDSRCPTSSECRHNSTNDTRCSTSIDCRRNSKNNIWRATSSECRCYRTNRARGPTAGESRHNYDDTLRSTITEPWQSLLRIHLKESSTEKSASTLWPEELRFSFSEEDAFTNCRKVANPMLKLANYIDTLLKDVGDNL